LGYNTNTRPEIWQCEFEKRFGKEAAPFVAKALHQASWVLPRIVASCYPYGAFPMTRGWAEKQRLGDLPAYAKAEGSDIQQFANFDEEALILIEGGESAKVRPAENSRWFADTAAAINSTVVQAEKHMGTRRNQEFESTVVDLKILANLALFHSRRIPAAVNYRLFERTKDAKALNEAIAHERSAIEAWRQLVAAAGDFYTEDLMMGVRGANLCGHWKDELTALERDLATLQLRQRELKPDPDARPAPRFPPLAVTGDGSAPLVIHQPVTAAPAGQPIEITTEVHDPADVKWVRLRYRSVNQHQDYRTLPMLSTGEKDQYRTVIPADDIPSTWDLMYFIEAMDKDGNGRIHPDLNKDTPYIVVKLQR